MTTYTVSSLAQLKSALAGAKGGDDIVLASGSYGKLDLNGTKFDDYVTIRSSNPDNPATFDSVSLRGVSNLRIDSVHVDNPGNGVSGARVVNIDDGSRNIEISNSEVNGKVDGNYSGFYGIYVGKSSNITLTNNDVHDVKDGMFAVSSSDITVFGNSFDYLANDSMKFASVSDVLIENNTGARHIFAGAGAHLDFIQFQGGASSNVVIRGNVYLPENEFYSQGIFLTPDTVNNVLIEQNIVYNGLSRGITVGSGSNVVIQNNTILTVPNAGHKASSIFAPDGATVRDNVYGFHQGGWSGSNLKAEWDNPSGEFYYDKLYQNASAGWGITIEDLRPVPGSIVDFGSGVGAEQRIQELLLEGSGTPGNTRPDAVDDQANVQEDASVNIDVLDNDSDPDGDTIEVASVGDAAHGTVTVNANGTLTYTPDDDYAGSDSFAYTLRDARGGTDTGQVVVTVAGAPDAPVAKDDTVNVAAETSITLDVLANDSDPDGDQLSIVKNGQPSNGMVTDLGDGRFSYTPDAGFAGTDSFTYTVRDPGGKRDTATVTVNVLEPGDLPAPIFADDGGSFDGSANGARVIAHSSAWEASTGTISFQFTADNLAGLQGLLSKDASFFGNGGHLGILLDGDDLWVRLQDGSRSYEIKSANVIEAGTEHAVALTFGPGGMELWLDGERVGGNSHSGGLNGNREPLVVGGNQWSSSNGKADTIQDGFDGTISDIALFDSKLDETEIALLTVGNGGGDGGPVDPPNAAPIALDDSATTTAGKKIIIDALSNDTDPEGGSLTIADLDQPTNGDVVVRNDGRLRYTPDDGFTGTDTFTYTVEDDQGEQSTATVTVDVRGGGSLPSPVFTDAGSSASDPRILAHNSAWEAPAGTLSFSFTANSLSGLQGLVSKDATKFGTGGHLTIVLKGDDLFARIQSTDKTHKIRVANVIDANTQYHVALSFGPDGLELWLDGELLGSTDYTGGLGGNFEPLVIGANQWSSSAGQSDKINHVFDGTVEDVALYDTQLDAGTISLIADGGSGGGGPVVDPNQAPDAEDDTAVVEQGDSVRVKVLQNDSDPDGDAVTIVDIDDPANGTATLNNNGSITYTPDAGFSGEETFTYTVSDGTDTDTASVSVTVEPSDPVGGGGTVTVSSLAELEDALDAATGGETILLANGNYGVLDIDGFRFAEFVTIRSASDLGAKFTKITVDNSSHIMIDGVHVDAPTNGGVGSAFVDIGAGSTDISFLNSEVNGSVNGKMVGAYGIRVHENSRQIDVSGNTVHDVEHGAVFFGVSDLVVSENDFNTLGSDSMKFGGVTDTLIENNSGASVTVPANGDHLDFIQFQGDGTDVTIRGNVFLLKEIKGFPSYPHQGIFLKDGEFNNVLIEQNLIYTNTVNAIYVSSKGGSGGNVTIRENTVLSPPDQTIWGNADIRMVSLGGDYVIENNVVDRVVDSVGGGQVSGNLSLQWERPGSANHYNSVYLDATAGGNATIDDFRPVPGGPADVGSGVGAEERISELTGSGEPMPNRAPNAANDMVETGIGEAISIAVLANDSDPDGDSLSIESLGSANNGQVSADSNGVLTYTPDAGFSGIDKIEYTVTDGEATDTATVSVMVAVQETGGASVIGTAMGLTEISGRSDVIEIAPDDALEVSEATIALGFNADTVSGKHGLVSKDASNFAGGGNHFAAYIENGVLKVRFQDGQSSLTLQATGIKAGQDYEMVTSFGDGEVSLWLDGKLADSAAFSTSWETNGEYLQFGANGWASKTGASGFTDVFDGTISDAVIADSVLNPNQLETIVRDMRADGSIQPADNDWSFDLL